MPGPQGPEVKNQTKPQTGRATQQPGKEKQADEVTASKGSEKDGGMNGSGGHPGTGPSFFLPVHRLTFPTSHYTRHFYSTDLPQSTFRSNRNSPCYHGPCTAGRGEVKAFPVTLQSGGLSYGYGFGIFLESQRHKHTCEHGIWPVPCWQHSIILELNYCGPVQKTNHQVHHCLYGKII